MMDKEIDIDRKLGKHVKKHEVAEQIDKMLAYGSVNLGLTNIKRENYSEERIKEDLKK